MLKTISLSLEDKKKCLCIWAVCEKHTMWREIAHGKDSKKIVLSAFFFHVKSKGPRTVSYSICPDFDSLFLG